MPITFPTTPLTGVVEIALGVDPASDPAGWSWTNITAFVRYAPGIQITKGRRDESSRVDPASARLELDNRDGRFCRRNPMGAYYGQLSKNTPIRIGVDAGDGVVRYRFHGFVNEWPTRWDKSGNDSTVPVTCSGILRRLTRNRKLGSALTRAISASSVVPSAYWPCEDSADGLALTSAVSPIFSVPDMVAVGAADFASRIGAPGSGRQPSFTAGGSLVGRTPDRGPVSSWRVQAVWKANTITAGDFAVPLSWTTADGNAWELDLNPGVLAFSETLAFTSPTAGAAVDNGLWHEGRVTAVQNGGNIDIKVYFDGVQVIAESIAGTVSRVVKVQANPLGATSDILTGIGHFVVWNGATTTPGLDTVAAMRGYVGETAHARMTRLCSEEGVSFTTAATSSSAMGAQQDGTLLDVLRECETADQGLLYEDQFGLGYLAASQRYNLASSLDLDFNSGDIAEAPEPADDDQQTLNRYVASRTGGSSGTFEDAESIAADGRYESSGTFNVEADSQLADIAAWRVHLGTVNEDRWPAIPIRLARTPNRITAWVAMTIGGRMTVANPPDQGTPDTIDAIVEGWTETIIPHMWEATLNTSPAQSFEVFEVAASGNRGRIDHATSTLNSSATTTATSLSVATTGSLWTTTATFPTDFPFDINCEGERITVTAITGTSSPQTFTVVRSVNGIVKAHGAGDQVSLWKPPVVGL